MISTRYSNAITETLYYLKGIKEEDVNRIPKVFLNFLKENASKGYKCNFDYTKPLNQLELMPETRGLIGAIALNYWCTTEEEKKAFKEKLKTNEKRN